MAAEKSGCGEGLAGCLSIDCSFWCIIGPCISCLYAYLAGVEVEVRRVKVVALGKVGDAHAEVAELVHRRRALLEPLELVGPPVLLGRLEKADGNARSAVVFPF